MERAWTRIAKEARTRVVHKQLLRDTNVAGVAADDRRQLDMVVYGLTRSGAALCCDATMVCPLDSRGRPTSRAADVDGAALTRAEGRKAETYPELVAGPAGRLVVLACETGGRWNGGAQRFVRSLARHRASEAPAPLRRSAEAAWRTRWWGLLSIAAQDALAATLNREGHLALGGPAPDEDVPLGDVLVDAAVAGAPSRLPLRQ